MLIQLRVDNLVLVREAELELGPGLTAITGETGAGKTLVAQAVGLLLGGRADAGLVGPGAREAYVEAAFELAPGMLPEGLAALAPEGEERDLVLARRVGADGRSRALAWGRGCARADLEAAGSALIEIVSQHEARRLARPAVQLDLLDAAAGAGDLRAEMAARFSQLQAARRALADVRAGAEGRARELLELRALAEAVEAAAPEAGEEATLVRDRDRLRHLDELLAAAGGAAERLNPDEGAGAIALAGEAARMVERASGLDPELAALAGELDDAATALQEASLGLRRYAEALEAEPGRLEWIEGRLAVFADLRRRFDAPDIEDLCARAASARARIEEADAGIDPAAALEGACDDALAAAGETADRLRALRAEAAGALAGRVEGHLADLGMEAARLEVALGERELGARGADTADLRLAANPGLPATPVGHGASGGELSRVALALRLAARAASGGETLVFDEVDAGIGGLTARALGDKLRALSRDTQVICITHLPQVAALADRHFRVVKETGDPSSTRVEQLSGGQIVDELVRMLGADASDDDARALAVTLREG